MQKEHPTQPDAQSALPVQQPVTDDAPAPGPPSKLSRALRRIALAALLAAALSFAYLFLLLGEPDEYDEPPRQPEQTITMPMGALDAPGEANVQSLAETFGQPVLSVQGGVTMQKARVYDTAFGGAYARRVTLTYAFEDGSLLTAESIRPTAAVTLLGGEHYKLDANQLYSLAGLSAARMQNGTQVCVFAQTDTAVYAILCPGQHADELPALLRQTTLIAAMTD